MTGFIYPNEAEINWSLLIVLYPFITGLVAGAFIISSLYHVFGIQGLKPVARFALVTSLAFLLVAPLPLLAHLGRPERALEIFLTPNPTSAMAGFGYIWLFYLILVVSEVWLSFRRDIIFYAERSSGVKKALYSLLTLGVYDVSEEAHKLDEKVIKFLALVGIPSAALLHGYVGFLFGAIKANPWWSTPLMPVIFLLSAIVSGMALVTLMYVVTSKVRGVPLDYPCLDSLLTWLMGFLALDVAIETLEVLNAAYESEESWELISQLIGQKIALSYFGIQIAMGSFLPLVILGAIAIWEFRRPWRDALGILASSLILIGVFTMRWNVVIGGQLISKSFRGFTSYFPTVGGQEGILVAAAFLALPFVLFIIITLALPPWREPSPQQEGTPSFYRRPRISF